MTPGELEALRLAAYAADDAYGAALAARYGASKAPLARYLPHEKGSELERLKSAKLAADEAYFPELQAANRGDFK